MRRNLVFALALFATTAVLAAPATIRKGFNVSPGGTLKLDAGVGDVTIVTGGTGVAIELVQGAADLQVDFKQSGNDVIVEAEHHNKWRFFDWDDDVKWNIRVPAQYNVDVRTSGGSIHTKRIGGNANLRTSGGGIKIEGATGEVDARTSGGSIEVGDTDGEVEVRTSGGSIHIARTGGNVVARTSGGSIRVEDARGAIDAKTS
ncbi:MAG: hypothetical protein ACLGH0_02075, partial [Thermoanaerobaculia bacterium]